MVSAPLLESRFFSRPLCCRPWRKGISFFSPAHKPTTLLGGAFLMLGRDPLLSRTKGQMGRKAAVPLSPKLKRKARLAPQLPLSESLTLTRPHSHSHHAALARNGVKTLLERWFVSASVARGRAPPPLCHLLTVCRQLGCGDSCADSFALQASARTSKALVITASHSAGVGPGRGKGELAGM